MASMAVRLDASVAPSHHAGMEGRGVGQESEMERQDGLSMITPASLLIVIPSSAC